MAVLTTLDKSPLHGLHEHYGIYDEIMEQAKETGVDSVIFSDLTQEGQMKCFVELCTCSTRRLIIDFDKDYPYFIVRMIPRNYGVSGKTP